MFYLFHIKTWHLREFITLISILKLKCSFFCTKRNTLLTNTDWSHRYMYMPCIAIKLSSTPFPLWSLILLVTSAIASSYQYSTLYTQPSTINIHICPTAFSTVHGTDEENLVDDQELLKLAIIFLSLRNLYILFKGDPVRRIQRPVTLWS